MAISSAVLASVAAVLLGIGWVPVGNPSNRPDPRTGHGRVEYPFEISKFEVTVEDYVEFMNAIAATGDPNRVVRLPSRRLPSQGGSRRDTLPDGTFSYHVDPEVASLPMTSVSFLSALRFANWLHNGKPKGTQDVETTEDGAYTIKDAWTIPRRNKGARVFIPSVDEWYKAAYYDPVRESYWSYATGHDEPPELGPPPGEVNSVNYDGASIFPSVGMQKVGSYLHAVSPCGTFDQDGNAFEWADSVQLIDVGLDEKLQRIAMTGGSLSSRLNSIGALSLRARDLRLTNGAIGFRVARVPEL